MKIIDKLELYSILLSLIDTLHDFYELDNKTNNLLCLKLL